MSKRFTKIICLMFAVVVAVGAALIAGCRGVYKANPLTGEIFTDDKAVSNGGFAVEKGNYVYFINGKQTNTADNEYGTPVKGAIYRIATTDLAARNYSKVDCVVPLVTYSGNQDAGIFIYGNYIYYSTPSTGKTASGAVENGKLDLKRTKLDGTETMMDAYVQFDDNSTEFRFVEVENTVYILYVATGEKLYDEDSGVTNLHSYNTKTGANTVLAYNVGAVQFDDEDKTNHQVYYTMNVRDYASDADYGYNQIYTVTADVTEPNEYDFSAVNGWDEDEDKYINCGTLVLDGIGETDFLKNQNSGTVFNYDPAAKNKFSYTYTLRAYVNGTVFYTRTDESNDGKNYLFSFTDAITEEGNPVTNNAKVSATAAEDDRILNDGASASDFKYLFGDNGALEAVLVADGNGIAKNVVDENGKLQSGKPSNGDEYFYVATGSSADILFTEENYLYYSVSGDGVNGYSVNRVDYTGKKYDDYHTHPADDNELKYKPVSVLDLDACSDWYKPELIENQIIFASETDKMTSYNYIMACDLRGEDGIMTNAEIKALNDKYDKIEEIFEDLGDKDDYPESTYANMVNSLRYAYFTGESWDVYLKGLAEACNAELEEDVDRVYSDDTKAMYNEFLAPAADNVWADYAEDKREVNGKEIFANRRDYYYSVMGKMSSDDAESYVKAFKSEYLKDYPETEGTWWGGLNTAARVFFILGMCAIGVILIGGGSALALVLIRKKKSKMPEFRKKKIKVDTTDDKDIDVYSDENADKTEEKPEE